MADVGREKNLEISAKRKNRRVTGRSLFGLSVNKQSKQKYIDDQHNMDNLI